MLTKWNCFIAVFLFVATVKSAEYYVSPDAQSNTNTCTTAQDPCGGIIAALQLAIGGDTINLLPGTYSGDLNVPFHIIQPGIIFQGQQGNQAVINCGNIFPYCGEVEVSGNTFVQYITFTGYVPYNNTQIAALPPPPPTAHVENSRFQSLLSIKMGQWNSGNNTLQFLNCTFTGNQRTETGRQFGEAAALIYSDYLVPNYFIKITQCQFTSNSVPCMNLVYSNADISSCTFNGNTGSGLATILSSTVHPFRGGAIVSVNDCQVDGNNVGTSDNNRGRLFNFDGTFCYTTRNQTIEQCSPFQITGTNFTNNGGGSLITLSNGAQLHMTRCAVSASSTLRSIAADGEGSRLTTPSRIKLESCHFSSANTILYGYFVDSYVTSCTLSAESTNSTLVDVTGDISFIISIFNTSVSSSTAVRFSNGMGYFDKCSFLGFNTNMEIGQINGLTLSSNVTTVVSYSSQFSSGSIGIFGTAFLFIQDNVFTTSSSNPVINCEFGHPNYPSEISFVGTASSLIGTGPLVSGSYCFIACDDKNEDICKVAPDSLLVVNRGNTGMTGWEITLITLTVLIFVYAIAASIAVGVIIFKVKKSRESAPLIN